MWLRRGTERRYLTLPVLIYTCTPAHTHFCFFWLHHICYLPPWSLIIFSKCPPCQPQSILHWTFLHIVLQSGSPSPERKLSSIIKQYTTSDWQHILIVIQNVLRWWCAPCLCILRLAMHNSTRVFCRFSYLQNCFLLCICHLSRGILLLIYMWKAFTCPPIYKKSLSRCIKWKYK